jgi:Flp pilus assembly protein TadD
MIQRKTLEGHKLSAEASSQGVMIKVIPQSHLIDEAVLDTFGLGMRFATISRVIKAMDDPAGFEDDVITTRVKRTDGQITFTFFYSHSPGQRFVTTLGKAASADLLAFLNGSISGDRFQPTNVAKRGTIPKGTGRNSPCSCGSGKRFKRCCGMRKPLKKGTSELDEFLGAEDLVAQYGIQEGLRQPALLRQPEYWQELGACLGTSGELNLALKAQRRALDLAPGNASIIADYAATLGAAGNNEDAWSMLEKLPNEDGRFSAIRGNTLDMLGRHLEAIAEYERAIAREATFELPYLRLLNILKRLDHPLYEYWLQRARRNLPKSPGVALAYSHWLICENRLEELAGAEWPEYLAHEPDMRVIGHQAEGPRQITEVQALQLIARSIASGDAAPLEKAARIIESAPDSWHLCVVAEQTALAARFFGRRDLVWLASRRFCTPCSKDRLDQAFVQCLLGHAALHAHNPGQAVIDAELGLKRSPDDLRILSYYWWALDDLGRSDEALQIARKVYEKIPEEPCLCYNIGYLANKTGHQATAAKFYELELKQRPDQIKAYENLAFIKLISGDISGAEILMDKWEKQGGAVLPADELLMKREKFTRLAEFARSQAGQITYALDLIRENKSSSVHFGSETKLPERKPSRDEMIAILTGGNGDHRDETLFALEMEKRGDHSIIAARLDGELPGVTTLPRTAYITILEAQCQLEDSMRADFAPCCMAFCKALEISLYQTVFVRFRAEISQLPSRNSLTGSDEAKRAIAGIGKGGALVKFVAKQVPLELGSMAFILPLCRGETARNLELMGAFRDWLEQNGLKNLYSSERPEKLQELARRYRNPAAHDVNFNCATAVEVKSHCMEHLSFLIKAGEPQSR